MYLLQPMMMKTILVWLLYGLIPRLGKGWGPIATQDHDEFMQSLYGSQGPAAVFVNLFAVAIWLGLL